ncbi:acyl-CoA dehydrogenase family protein [Novosphingobium sp. JCM 18896]|uniref:acyl-CoA dehydrogenase family protein n=1 Tax=Novosphingobium sp. JCM 18896 TaxID=2989731 RepID=UPI002223AD4D|nr:acyl-CoA dehydrogenase family protein [Novosphingobium sp. JCM 18896]MCW1432489.1 acyl-CoA dehydrogenase family protein [Novosphingobium sp. JCM 18896]
MTGLDEFRAEVRAWLACNVPKGWRHASVDPSQFVTIQRDWFRRLVDGGYAVPHWPANWPGGGRSLEEQKVIYQELARADAPRLLLTFVSTYHAACTIMEWGTQEQQDRLLPAILDGEIWCQGFSEPGAGSDLASVRTKASRRGDSYIVNGQKIWSTVAQYADKCLLLARTSNETPKQRGLTFLLCDLNRPGITIRPIHQIHGDEEFAEIFFDDVEIPASDRLGEEGQGWVVAQATLASERGLTLLELSERMRGAMWRIADQIACGGREEDTGVLRDFGRLATRVQATNALADQYLAWRIASEEQPGHASLIKLHYARVLREFTAFGLRLASFEGQVHTPITFGGGMETGNWMADFMNSYAWTIAGGSDEIQRNIISEKLLGMPREPRMSAKPEAAS